VNQMCDFDNEQTCPLREQPSAPERLSRRGALGRLLSLLAGLGGLSLLASCPGGTIWSRGKQRALANTPPNELWFKTYFVPLNVVREIDVAGQPAYLAHFNDGNNTYWAALSRRCTHAGCKLDYYTGGKVLRCPCHGAVFDLHGNPISGPAKRRLERWAIEVKADGVHIYADRPLDPQQQDVPVNQR
jgi:Rieske Fe-S protein